eukprot:1177952-Prymnesium_polylepis.1
MGFSRAWERAARVGWKPYGRAWERAARVGWNARSILPLRRVRHGAIYALRLDQQRLARAVVVVDLRHKLQRREASSSGSERGCGWCSSRMRQQAAGRWSRAWPSSAPRGSRLGWRGAACTQCASRPERAPLSPRDSPPRPPAQTADVWRLGVVRAFVVWLCGVALWCVLLWCGLWCVALWCGFVAWLCGVALWRGFGVWFFANALVR